MFTYSTFRVTLLDCGYHVLEMQDLYISSSIVSMKEIRIVLPKRSTSFKNQISTTVQT